MIFWWITCNYLLNMWFSMLFRSYVPSTVYGQQRPPLRRWSKPAATKQPGEVINVVNPCKPSNRPLVLLLGLPDYVEFSVLIIKFPIYSDLFRWIALSDRVELWPFSGPLRSGPDLDNGCQAGICHSCPCTAPRGPPSARLRSPKCPKGVAV